MENRQVRVTINETDGISFDETVRSAFAIMEKDTEEGTETIIASRASILELGAMLCGFFEQHPEVKQLIDNALARKAAEDNAPTH